MEKIVEEREPEERVVEKGVFFCPCGCGCMARTGPTRSEREAPKTSQHAFIPLARKKKEGGEYSCVNAASLREPRIRKAKVRKGKR